MSTPTGLRPMAPFELMWAKPIDQNDRHVRESSRNPVGVAVVLAREPNVVPQSRDNVGLWDGAPLGLVNVQTPVHCASVARAKGPAREKSPNFTAGTAMSARSWLQIKFARTRLSALLVPRYLNATWKSSAANYFGTN